MRDSDALAGPDARGVGRKAHAIAGIIFSAIGLVECVGFVVALVGAR